MYENLLKIKEKYIAIEDEIQTLTLSNNFKATIELSKQLSLIENIKKTFDEYQNLEKNIQEVKELSHSTNNKEIIDLAKEDIKLFTEEKDKIINQLKIFLIPKDPLDEKDVIVEMRGAAGGDEANIFVGNLFNAYKKFAESLGWKIKLLDVVNGTSGGFTNLSFQINGEYVYSKLKYESGIHRVQRVPITETQGRVHTSTISVVVLPKPDKVDIKIDNSDLKIDTYKSSGAGGQHVNTTDSAVRITHIPSGIVASSQDGRSQHDNKDKAIQMLSVKLFEEKLKKQKQKIGNERKNAIGTGARSEKIRTYNYPQNRVSDHRINLNVNLLDKIMEGKMSIIIDGLIAYNQSQLLSDKK